jgi:ribosomal protein S18 acetylase RimI-like enzyme
LTRRSKVLIRQADVGDAADVASLGAAAFVAAHAPFTDASSIRPIVAHAFRERHVRQRIADSRLAERSWFLVAYHQKQLLGFLEYDESGTEAELHRLYVDPSLKGTGIGSALLEQLHRRLPGQHRYRVTVAAANAEALLFYERRGFRETDRTTHHYPGVDFPPDAKPTAVVFLQFEPTFKERDHS